MSHTPGPWAVSKNDTFVFGQKQGNGLEPIGFIYGPACAENSDYGKRCIANVHLCAAAPAMLEALEHIAASLYYNDYGDPALLNSFDESIIDAAIKAAKGEV